MASLADPELKAAYERVQGYLKKLQEIQSKKTKLVESRHALGSQKNENDLVRQELSAMEEGAKVYKLVGPALVQQDAADAKSIVEKRLDYISSEIQKTDRQIGECEAEEHKIRGEILALQQGLNARVEAKAAAAGAA